MSRIAPFVAACAFLAGAPAYAQYGLADGGFDTQGASISTYCYFGLSNCPAGSWQGTSGLVHSGNTDWGGVAANTPQTYGFVQQTSVLSQTFVATASGQFRLSWFDADRPGAGGHTYIVKVNGTAVGTYSPTTSYFTRQLSAVFTLTAGSSYTLSFEGQSLPGNRSAFIDNVSIVTGQSSASYTYDALGRLVSTTASGGANGGVVSTYTLDQAGNRTRVLVTGSPN